MLKQYLKYFAVLVSLFVLFTNVGFSVLEKSKDYKEISVCCNVEVLKNNCCEYIETCSTTYTNGCCCTEDQQTIQFLYNVPVDNNKKELAIFPSTTSISFNTISFTNISEWKLTSVPPPPNISKRLSILQVYRI